MTGKRGRGRPKGTTAARGYKVSPGRPAGSSHKRSDIKSEPGESSNEGTSSLDAKPDSTTPCKFSTILSVAKVGTLPIYERPFL